MSEVSGKSGSGSDKNTEKVQTPSEFVRERLGLFSSHPGYARIKARWLLQFPLILVGLAGAWLVWKGVELDFQQWLLWLSGESWYAQGFVFVLVFLLSAAATAILSLRASLTNGLSILRKGQDSDHRNSSNVMVLLTGVALAALLVFVLPFLIPGDPTTQGKAAKYMFYFSLLPYVLTLALFDLFSPVKKSRFWMGSAVLWMLLTGSFLLISFKAGWAELWLRWLHLDQLPAFGKEISSMAGGAAQLFFRLLAGATLLLFTFSLGEWSISGLPQGFDKRRESWALKLFRLLLRFVSLPVTLLIKCYRWLQGKMKKKEEPEKKEETQTPDLPDWIQVSWKRLTAPKRRDQCLLSELAFVPFSSSEVDTGLASASGRNPFFGGVRPTQDQWKVLEMFVRNEHLNDPDRPAELLIEGINGVGKTTTLQACALMTALVRGERVVIFAPDNQSRSQLLNSLRTQLRSLMAHYYFSVNGLLESLLDDWLNEPSLFPDIIVADPADWEALFFGGRCEDKEKRDLMGDWLLSFTTIGVDDIASTSWTTAQMSHLPFLIDKQRILLSAAGQRLRTLITVAKEPEDPINKDGKNPGGETDQKDSGAETEGKVESSAPSMEALNADPSRQAIMHRLFGEAVSPQLNKNFMLLRRWQQFECACVELSTGDEETTVYLWIREMLIEKKQVLYFHKDFSEKNREEIQDSWTQKMKERWTSLPDPEGRPDPELSPSVFRILSHINDPVVLPDVDGESMERVVIYCGTKEDSIRPQLQSRFADRKTLFIAIKGSRAGSVRDSEPPMGYPMMASRQATPLALAHLRSLSVHLARNLSMPRDVLGLCGFARRGMLPQSAPSGKYRVDSSLRLELDPPETADFNPLINEGIKPMVRLRPFLEDANKISSSAAPVKFEGAMQYRWRYWLDPKSEGRIALTGQTDDPTESERISRWVDDNDQEICGALDLSGMDELIAERKGQRFYCHQMERSSQKDLIIRGRPFSEFSDQTTKTLPVRRIHLDLSGTEKKTLGLDGSPWTAPPKGVTIGELRWNGEGINDVEGREFDCRLELLGAATPAGRSSDASTFGIPVSFSFPARVTAILVDPSAPADRGEEFERRLLGQLSRPWIAGNIRDAEGDSPSENTGCFWPEWTLAFQSGLKRFCPRVTSFSLVIGFKTGSASGCWLLLEPTAVQGTASELMKTLMEHRELAWKKVFSHAHHLLSRSGHFHPGWTGPVFVDESPLDPSTALGLIQTFRPESNLNSQETEDAAAPSTTENPESKTQ